MAVGSSAVAEIKMTYSANIQPKDRRHCMDSDDAYQILAEWWDRETVQLYETFAVLFLDRASRVIGIYEASRGGTTGTIADAKLIIAAALKCRAEMMVLAHNHPSGTLHPSKADVRLTKKLATAARFHDLALYDHLLISPWDGGYYSFANSSPDIIKGYDLNDLQ